MYRYKIAAFCSFLLFLSSCSTQIQLRQHVAYKLKLKKGTTIFAPSKDNLGTADTLVLSNNTKGKIIYRDAAKENISDAKIILPTNEEKLRKSNMGKAFSEGNYYFLLPRNPYGKTIDYYFKTKFTTSYTDFGIFVNPLQFYILTKRPYYYEPVELKNFRLGINYSFTQIFHKFDHLSYKKNSISYGPYVNLGFTHFSTVSLEDSVVHSKFPKGHTVFGTNVGFMINYATNDKFGVGLLVGHEIPISAYSKYWLFYKNNITVGLVFVLKFSRF